MLRMILGRQLQALRVRAGLSFERAGAAIGVSHSTVRRLEAAKVARLRLADVEKLLRTYGVTDPDEIEAFLRSVREANKRSWWHGFRDVVPDWLASYLSLEQAALQIRGYEAQAVHGLLQTEEYARALFQASAPQATAQETERRVELQMRRQELLRRPEPPRLWVVLDETVLRWPVGGAAVMRAQIDHLIGMLARPHVTVQIMPFGHGPHPALRAGSFHVLRFQAPELPDVVYLDGLREMTYLDKTEDVLAYRESLDRLGAQAAPPARTEALLTALRREFSG
mgnify:CR=1 FL=1